MDSSSFSPKIIGSVIIGFAMIAGAYVLTNFGESTASQPANIQAAKPAERVAIVVTDEDNNGIEDWRDEFLDTKSIVVAETVGEYVPPETLTGRTGIQMVENIAQARMSGLFGATNQEIVDGTVDALINETKLELYDIEDIDIMLEWEDSDIVNYANTLAVTMIDNSNSDLGYELDILHDITRRGKTERIDELKQLVEVYRGYRDDALKVPVPEIFAKEHLDLINTYHSVWQDLDAMLLALEDPIVTLLHVNRYQDDALGLAYALENLYLALEPHAGLFTVEDPAVLFVFFSPEYKNQ